jgi:hypothetical protein
VELALKLELWVMVLAKKNLITKEVANLLLPFCGHPLFRLQELFLMKKAKIVPVIGAAALQKHQIMTKIERENMSIHLRQAQAEIQYTQMAP